MRVCANTFHGLREYLVCTEKSSSSARKESYHVCTEEYVSHPSLLNNGRSDVRPSGVQTTFSYSGLHRSETPTSHSSSGMPYPFRDFRIGTKRSNTKYMQAGIETFIEKTESVTGGNTSLGEGTDAKSLLELQRQQGVAAVIDLNAGRNATHTSPTTFNNLVRSLNEVVERRVTRETHASPFVAIGIDESTDRSQEKHVVLVIRYIRTGELVTTFLRCAKVNDGKAVTIYQTTLDVLQHYNIPLRKTMREVDGPKLQRFKTSVQENGHYKEVAIIMRAGRGVQDPVQTLDAVKGQFLDRLLENLRASDTVMIRKVGEKLATKIIDFGIACWITRPIQLNIQPREPVSGHIAPEVAAGGPVSVYSDIFSLGRLVDDVTRSEGLAGHRRKLSLVAKACLKPNHPRDRMQLGEIVKRLQVT
ncbi:hypothetical protein Bbelb_109160 [Branchiostoma belcheri]|nr:hypothetical protein Bbelb_109160 [Branchiostoma belcheri]